MNKKTVVVVIGLVLSLSMMSLSTVVFPVKATVSVSVQKNPVSMNPIPNPDSAPQGPSIPAVPMNPIKPSGYQYDLLIIAPAEYGAALQPLVDHKTNFCGIKTKLVTTGDIYSGKYSSVQGRDDPEKIKYFIKYAIETWNTKYVLLVGGVKSSIFGEEWLVPVRYCYNGDVGTGFDEPRFISELYYADIYDKNGDFSSWDTNNNGIYGEWYMNEKAKDQPIDLYPDVYVGRLPCKTTSQVNVMVDKIIKYETTTYGKSWFKNIIGIGGDTYPDGRWHFPTPGYEGEQNTGKVLENMSNIGFNPIHLWTSDGSFSDQKDIKNKVNEGAGFMFLDGHSAPSVWGTHLPNSNKYAWGPDLFKNAYFYSNSEKLPICIWGGCHTFQFDVGISKIFTDPDYKAHTTWVWECLAWSFVRLPYGGAIAAIGCTGLGLTKEDRDDCWQQDHNIIPTDGNGDYLDSQFFFRYISDGGSSSGSDIRLGEIMGKAVSDYLDKYPINWNKFATNDSADDAKTVQQWELFGDPSLKIGGYEQSQLPGGDLEAEIANAESNVNGYVGVSLQFQASASGGTSSYAYEWQFEGGQLNYNTGKTAECTWYSPGLYKATVKVTDTNGKECTFDTFVSIGSKPNAPSGPKSGKIGVEYTFTALITGSPSQDLTFYIFDWGDETCSDPIGPYRTGQTVEAKHAWSNPGQHQIRVKACLIDSSKKDLFEETGWSDPLIISMDGEKIFDGTFPHEAFSRYPNREVRPSEYTKDLGIVKATPELIKHLEQIINEIGKLFIRRTS